MTGVPPAHTDEPIDPGSGRPMHSFVVSTVVVNRTTRYLPPRSAPSLPTMRRSKYDSLSIHLARLDQPIAELSFDELDGLVGGLPNSADRYRSWWANTSTSPQGRSWRRVAWSVADVDRLERTVSFARDSLPESPGFTPGYAPHWIQVKQASKAITAWMPGRVKSIGGETVSVRFPSLSIVFFCRLFPGYEALTVGQSVWFNTKFHLLEVPTEGGSKVFSVRRLSVSEEPVDIPAAELWGGSSPGGFGLTQIDYSDLDPTDMESALNLIGQELREQFREQGSADLQDAIWRVGEHEFGGNGDHWVNSWEVSEDLLEIADPLFFIFFKGTMVDYSEYLDLVDFGPGLCFVAFEPIEPDDWHFVAHVDRNNVGRITEIAVDAFQFGQSGDADRSDLSRDEWDVYPPLNERDFS